MNIFTGELKSLFLINSATGIADIRNGTLLIDQGNWDNMGFDIQKTMDVFHISSSGEYRHAHIGTQFMPESGNLSNAGNYVISRTYQEYISELEGKEAASAIPEKCSVLSLYSSDTGELLWSKVIDKAGYSSATIPLYFEDCNVMIGVLSDYNEVLWHGEGRDENGNVNDHKIIYAIKGIL